MNSINLKINYYNGQDDAILMTL